MESQNLTVKSTIMLSFFLLFFSLTFYAQSKSLVVIDSEFANKSQIISSLSTDQMLVELNGATNAWQKIRENLESDLSVKTIHLFTNATYNSIQMGGVVYDIETINNESELGMLEGLYDGTHLQLLIYNCNLGSNQGGIDLIDVISERAYLNIGVCTNCTSIFDVNFNFGYSSLNQPISITPITLN